MPDVTSFIAQQFSGFQKPQFWYYKAIGLREASDTLLTATMPKVLEYLAAEVAANAELDRSELNHVEIKCTEPQLFPIYHLYGAALENLFKAKISLTLPDSAFGDKLPKELDGHSLTNLASTGAIPLQPSERELLQWLSEVVIWKSRYQTPTQLKYYTTFYAQDHRMVETLTDSISAIKAIFDRVESEVLPHFPPRTSGFPLLVRI